jgi:surfeit locus 1 family protein
MTDMAGRQFRPRLVPTLVTLLLLPVLISLGFWQLDRAGEKRQMEQTFAERSALAELRPTGALDGDAHDLRYRRIRVTGEYLRRKQVLMDNQVNNSQVGYQVYTALQIDDGPSCYLINRGWVPLGQSREQLPELPTTSGPVNVAGVLDTPPGVGIKLGDKARTGSGWPAVVQWLDIEVLTNDLGCDVQPLIVRLDPTENGGFVRNWQRVVLTPDKHIGYAVQWFALALALVIIYIVVNFKKPT